MHFNLNKTNILGSNIRNPFVSHSKFFLTSVAVLQTFGFPVKEKSSSKKGFRAKNIVLKCVFLQSTFTQALFKHYRSYFDVMDFKNPFRSGPMRQFSYNLTTLTECFSHKYHIQYMLQQSFYVIFIFNWTKFKILSERLFLRNLCALLWVK